MTVTAVSERNPSVKTKLISAIVRADRLETVEERLKREGVEGISVSSVKGFGEYANFFTHDWLVRHSRIEVFAADAEAPGVVRAIHEEAHTGASGDGVIAVLPVERYVRIRNDPD